MKHLYRKSDRSREHPIDDGVPHRSAFRRDYARLLHSPAFRRLQGKTQLFPSVEHDFFRNCLTHSLEVAQVAKSIALRLNHCNTYFQKNKIDTDLVETAALAHDLGHPPFGHNGERALNDCMRGRGGFEGNAQSLRILSKLSKKEPPPSPEVGLNLTHRTLAAILKYDNLITIEKKDDAKPIKGYYQTEEELVKRIKRSVLGKTSVLGGEFKTVECQIMDIADDIAYSTYDLEDALKAGFVTPLQMILAVQQDEVYRPVIEKLGIDRDTLLDHTIDIWLEPALDPKSLNLDVSLLDIQRGEELAMLSAAVHAKTQELAEDGTARTKFTSRLVDECIEGTDVVVNDGCPALSEVKLNPGLLTRVNVLKHLTYELVIQSPNLKTVEHRGGEIVKDIFRALSGGGGDMLMPNDYRERVVKADGKLERARAICDFIAGMTDRYAIEFYGRLRSESPQTIFKPL